MTTKIKNCLSFIILLTAFSVCFLINKQAVSHAQKSAETITSLKATAFVNVSVVPMDTERVLENQTVIVRAGRIAEIGAAKKVKITADVVQIDGRGKFLMPGLADMHAHLQAGAGTLDDAAGQQLQLFLMNGVTTVRNMIGKPEHLILRDRINKGELVAPTIYTAGAPIIINRIASPEAAAKDVIEQKNAGYDLIKVHEGLTPEIYQAIVETANKVGIPFAGHVTATVGLQRALSAKQTSIEHLDGYIQYIIADNSPVKPNGSQVQLGEVLNYVDEKKIPAVLKQTKDGGVWNCPTLALFQIIVSPETTEDLLKLPELKYVPPKVRDAFAKQKQPTADIPVEEGVKYTALRFRLVRELEKAGAKLLVGSDPGQMFLVAGFGTHKELQSFVEAGLSPFQALEAATKNPAEYLSRFMKIPNDFGVVKIGSKADLLLLDANPLQSISNTEKIAGVMSRGRWISKEEINKTLAAIAARQQISAQ